MSAHMTHGSSLSLDPFNRYLFDFEAVMDAPPDAGAPADQGSPSGDSGAGGQAGDAGAAAPVDTPPAGEAAGAVSFDGLLEDPQNQERLGQMFETWQTQREQAAADAQTREQAQAAENDFTDIEEALGLLGVDPSRFKAYIGRETAPLQQAAQQVQQQEALKWVEGQLTGLATAHPSLLGTELDKLAELKDDQGQPIVNVDEARLMNRSAVLYAASGLEQAHGLDQARALSEGAKQVEARDALIAKAAVAKYRADLSAATGAPAGNAATGSGAVGATQISGVEGGDELSIARRWAAENRRP